MTPDITSAGIASIFGGVVTMIGAAFALWKTKSRTQVSVKEDLSRISWIAGLDARMGLMTSEFDARIRQMQVQMDGMVTKERATHDLHQECIRLSERLTERVNFQDAQIVLLRRLLCAARPELRDVVGTSIPGKLGDC